MGKNTGIQWCDDTSNPTGGCGGCELFDAIKKTGSCYAFKITRLRGGKHKGFAKKFWIVEELPGRMAEAARWSDLAGTERPDKPWLGVMPRVIFISDMSDALSNGIGFDYLKTEVIDVVSSSLGVQHQWPWLTKRPGRMAEFSGWLKRQGIEWPSNLWAGTSITTSKTTSRIDRLLRVGDENTVHFVSVEPQWEPIDLRPWLPRLGWVIQGGQSGDRKFFDTAWARGLRDQCLAANVPYFLKQLGSYVIHGGLRIKFEDGHGGNWDEWPSDLRVRQMPAIKPFSATSMSLTGATSAR